MSDSLPQRIQLSRKRGWRMPDNTELVSRPSIFGNPFKPIDPKNHDHACRSVEYYEKYLSGHEHGFDCGPSIGVAMTNIPEWDHRREVIKLLPKLRGKNLACWCKAGTPCHADVLLRLANAAP